MRYLLLSYPLEHASNPYRMSSINTYKALMICTMKMHSSIEGEDKQNTVSQGLQYYHKIIPVYSLYIIKFRMSKCKVLADEDKQLQYIYIYSPETRYT